MNVKKTVLGAVATVATVAVFAGACSDSTPAVDNPAATTSVSSASTAASGASAAVPKEGKAALDMAESYLETSGFSAEGLRKQLVFEKFPKAAVDYAVKAVKADWNAEALEAAESYMDTGGMSRAGLRSQLDFDGFTKGQIDFALRGLAE